VIAEKLVETGPDDDPAWMTPLMRVLWRVSRRVLR
jgi:hypothetical protein